MMYLGNAVKSLPVESELTQELEKVLLYDT